MLNSFCLFSCFISIERFYHSAHANLPKPTTSKISKCPFRATLQAQGVHSTSSLTAFPDAQLKATKKEDGKKENEDGCQCVAEGLQPKGNNIWVYVCCSV